MIRRLTLVGAVCALLTVTASAQAASIWTPISSGTTGTISAIDYQSASRFWYATTGGQVAALNGASFVQGTGITPGDNITGLAFQPGGAVGFAVAGNGDIFHSLDSGATWTAIAHPTTRTGCTVSSTPVTESELNDVVWSSTTTVFLLGDNGTVLRSTAATGASPSFAEINKNSVTCVMQTENAPQDFTGATFLAANSDNALFVARDFGRVYASSNASTAASPSGSLVSDGTTNSFQGDPKIARDAGDPSRVFIVDHNAGGAGCGALCLEVSSNGGAQTTTAKFPNDSNPVGALFGITSVGGVEVAAGSGGEIFTSNDGINFYNQPADGTLATENWRAVGAYDAQHAAVGGENGALAITGVANTIPDITAPTGTISGPTTVTSGTATTYTAVLADNPGGSGINPASTTWTASGFPVQHGGAASYTFPSGVGEVTLTVTFADNAGNQGSATLDVTVRNAGPPTGSKPTTISAGGATIKIFRVVTVTGRNARFVPVIVSATKPRKFTAQVLPVKGKRKKALATGRLTLKGRHGGHGTIRVKLGPKVKPGAYVLVVRETTLKGRRVGKPIKIRFTLR